MRRRPWKVCYSARAIQIYAGSRLQIDGNL